MQHCKEYTMCYIFLTISMMVLLPHQVIVTQPIPLTSSEQPPLIQLALTDIIHNKLPELLKDLVFYPNAVGLPASANAWDIVNMAIRQLNGSQTARIEQPLNVTETAPHASRFLNVLVVDSLLSFR